MPQSFKEEGLKQGRKQGMMRADREVLVVLFTSRFDPRTVELLRGPRRQLRIRQCSVA